MLDDLPRGVRSRRLNEQQTPLSAWLDPDALAKSNALRFGPSKIFLGVVGGTAADDNGERFMTGGHAIGLGDDRHAVLCAGSRAGKGRSCLIPTLLEYRGSVLALDPKGELANVTARRRAQLGQRVAIVDPFGVCAPRLAAHKARFNPMAMLDVASPSLIADAGLVADAVVIGSANADPHWDESARNLIEGIILHVATYPGYAGTRTLVTVRELLKRAFDKVTDLPEGFEGDAPPQVRTEMVHNAAQVEATNPDLAAALEGAARDFYDKADRERASVLSVALRNTKFLDYPELRACLSGHDFDLGELKTAPQGLTIYLCLPAGRMATCNRWFRLFVNLAFEAMERERRVKPAIPVLAVLEEFHVLGFMQQLETAAALIAGFGMKLLIVLQDLTQLRRHYKDGWETFLGNAGIMIFFGNSDMTTLDYISKRCGSTSLIVERKNEVTTSQRTGGATGTSWSLEVRDLLTPEEASRFFGRDDVEQRQLLIRPGLPPAIIQRVKYDRHELFKGKFDPVD
ncbi:MAG: type IV secretory system conjugative DNA transfer family protein [Alphaproteobacteria bacterium]|nr:type IV secretory system conjugative DNA transfer family protein [Alphaproteobacteria bacterium]